MEKLVLQINIKEEYSTVFYIDQFFYQWHQNSLDSI